MKNLILIASFTMLLISCGEHIEKHKKELVVQETQPSKETEHHHGESEAITLNNGQKWKVDDNMMKFFRKTESSVNSFQGTELTDYKALSKEITANLDSITANCTMKGQAHDELHKWLVPFLGDAEAFAEAKDKNEASVYYKTIMDSFKTFNQYFE